MEGGRDDTSRVSDTLFDSGGGSQTPVGPGGKRRSWWKPLTVILLLIVVGAVILAKSRRGSPRSASGPRPNGSTASAPERAVPPETVLAIVNGEKITARELEETLQGMPDEYRTEFARQKDALLEEMILRKLLVQEARRTGIMETEEYRQGMAAHAAHPGHEEHVLVDALLRRDVLGKVQVTDDDLRAFYDEYRDQLPGKPGFDEAKEMIRPSVMQQKQYEALEAYLSGLKERASIERNEQWVEAQKAAAADNPLDRALKSGKPVLADFGRGTCIPCKMMKPILDRLAKELEGRIHVLVLDTGEYGYLARRYRIRMIPTQIFFDENGKEVFRHEGFMSREDILTRLKELGMPTG